MPRPKRSSFKSLPPGSGRAVKPINWARVDELLMAGCDGSEIAAVFHMHPHTFYDRVQIEKGMHFTHYQVERLSEGNSMLREQQFLKAVGKTELGDNTMLVWLGKNRLKQVDKQPDERATETVGLIHNLIAKAAGKDIEPQPVQQTIPEHKGK